MADGDGCIFSVVKSEKMLILRGKMEIKVRIFSEEDIEGAKEYAVDALKDRLWEEVWRSEIDLPGLDVRVSREGDGYVVTARIERVPGENCGGPDRGQRTG